MASVNGIATFGETRIVRPTGPHKATVVWLHDIGYTGIDSARFVRTLNLPNVKWICPTAPTLPVTCLGGAPTTAWFNVAQISENMQDDLVSINTVTSFVINLFSSEPGHVKKGLGGIGLGAAQALYLGSNYAIGWNPIDLKVVVALNGWLPARRNFNNNLGTIRGAVNLAASLPILLTNETSSVVTVPQAFGLQCANDLHTAGFPIYFTPNQRDHAFVCNWLKTYLEL